MAKASDIIKQAQKWVGRKEADGSFKEIINVYNGHKPLARGVAVQYTNEWCATFVSAVAIMCNATDIMPTECGCERMIELYKKIGCFIENENRVPNVGELIYYDWADGKKYATTDNQGWSDHIGIVEKVEGNKITVIEGNYNSSVARRTLEVNGRYIRGYATPKYEKEATVEVKPTTTTSASSTSAIKVGDIVSITKGAKYYNSTKGPKTWIINKKWVVKQVSGSRVVIDKSEDGNYNINSPIDAKYLTVVKKANANNTTTSTTTTVPVYYPKYTGNSNSLDAILAAIGVPSQYRGNYAKRKPIAVANGITDYEGKEEQNIKLKRLAREGKLKKV